MADDRCSDGASCVKVFLSKHGEGIDDVLGCIAAKLVHQSFSKVISHRHQQWRGTLLVVGLHASGLSGIQVDLWQGKDLLGPRRQLMAAARAMHLIP